MTKDTLKNNFLPALDGRALDFVKICAAVFMVMDHVNHVWFDSAVFWMSFLGRATFPLFCYALAVSFLRGGPQKVPGYAATLILFGIASQPFTTLAWGDLNIVNVLITLACGAVFLSAVHKLQDKYVYGLHVLGMLTMLDKLPFEFGITGIMLPSAIYMVLRGKKLGYLTLLPLLYLINTGGIGSKLVTCLGAGSCAEFGIFTMVFLYASVVPWMAITIGKNLPQDGRLLSRYFLHVFYPTHIFLIWAAYKIFFS